MSENEKNVCGIDGCGCGENEHEHQHEDSCSCGCGDHDGACTVELEDEHGNVVSCDVIDGFVYNDSEFALVQNPEDGSVYLFKVVGEGEDGELVVPDDEEFKAATAYYESTLEKDK
ncbi:hypothetical protein DUF1292 [Clostridium pasteurianum DSM 525 = ATCC 6013]|uniref:DUF1292 domain-containing protein n=1 Tax=Clostridium pasteurianum DSM 525 = ATCC 6013 TaxID=1262449 RepID=A0A0H3J1P3_CLOPA|nr:DUF1292 domain-containing protein [Clostridium pasteurianum]AJA47821.1 hypothetical protein DUF1292 [Clostridium pasteurianum DSM 525 = ATCC 6013]AJA51809.1 hypothetical protein DUF1292 [Clostridium pasteurianum DSM 525 = ATCC 6013]AOZ75113.1 hypothetical protein AQ983_08480 [Clostridium pasteurianum DSM 525 = ATCC 6013]AOZ78908.1 hypothetical protein AQ984_08470 [Clostridium pasteurianum]ELP59722.1 hypothetical protein F502_07653 [Clostridium pasteurianum DSM 525 = ATCC 6013]